jgi:hypothetical protein
VSTSNRSIGAHSNVAAAAAVRAPLPSEAEWTCAVRQARYGGTSTSGGSGRAAGSCLLLPVGRDSASICQDLRLFPEPHQGVPQRVRMGLAAGRQGGHRFTELGNRFAACDDPTALQAICDRLLRGTITVFSERWIARLPLPTRPGLCPSLALRRPTCHGPRHDEPPIATIPPRVPPLSGPSGRQRLECSTLTMSPFRRSRRRS